MSGRLLTVKDWEKLAKEAQFRAEDLAALCRLSLRQLERRVHELFQMTPSHWLQCLQCRLAKDLISQGCSNKAVARDLYFGDGPHLCHLFKKVYGCSPQTFAPDPGKRSR